MSPSQNRRVLLFSLLGSNLLFNLVMIDLLWGQTWLSKQAEVALLPFFFLCLTTSVHFLFRYLGLTLRQKVGAWIVFVGFAGYTVARRFSSYDLMAHGFWSPWLIWSISGLAFFFASFGLALLVIGAPKDERLECEASPFTVESEHPDHVLYVSVAADDNRVKQH